MGLRYLLRSFISRKAVFMRKGNVNWESAENLVLSLRNARKIKFVLANSLHLPQIFLLAYYMTLFPYFTHYAH